MKKQKNKTRGGLCISKKKKNGSRLVQTKAVVEGDDVVPLAVHHEERAQQLPDTPDAGETAGKLACQKKNETRGLPLVSSFNVPAQLSGLGSKPHGKKLQDALLKRTHLGEARSRISGLFGKLGTPCEK